MSRFAILLPLLLLGCATPDVTATCRETGEILAAAQPFLVAAPPEIRLVAAALGAGTVACGSPQYAEGRGRVLAWLRSRGAVR